MTIPDRIPLPSNFTPPFTVDKLGTIWGSDGRYVAVSQDHSDTIARVLTAYYADQPAPSQPVGVPQFVVVNWNDGGEENEMSVATRDISEIGDVVRLRNGREIPIVEAEYDRLKSILAPGQ